MKLTFGNGERFIGVRDDEVYFTAKGEPQEIGSRPIDDGRREVVTLHFANIESLNVLIRQCLFLQHVMTKAQARTEWRLA